MSKQLRVVYLMPQQYAEIAAGYAAAAGFEVSAVIAETSEELREAINGDCDLLLAFSTSVIVEESILSKPRLVAVNIHGASPEYPGRDPHHFAHYHHASTYGATLHYMMGKVDSGPIVDVEILAVDQGMTPVQLLELGTQAGLELIRRFFADAARNGWPIPRPELKWGGRRTTRKDFLSLCKIECGMSREEFDSRLAATAMPGYSNLYVELHGYRFRIEGRPG